MLATLAPNEIYIYININIHSWNFSDCRVFNYFVFFCQMARETSINNSSVRFPSAVALPLNVPQIEKADFFFRSYSESYFALMINNARPLQMAHSPGTHAMPHVHSTRHNNTQHVRKQLYFVVAVKINNRRRCRRRRRHRRALLYSLRNFTANSFMNSAWPCTRNSFIWMGPCSSAAGTELSLQLTLPKRRRKKHDAVETYNHIGVSFARIRKVSFELWVFLKFFFWAASLDLNMMHDCRRFLFVFVSFDLYTRKGRTDHLIIAHSTHYSMGNRPPIHWHRRRSIGAFSIVQKCGWLSGFGPNEIHSLFETTITTHSITILFISIPESDLHS